MTRRLVVIGNGMVGQRMLDELLPGWAVTVLGAEPCRAYDRVRLSAYVDGATAAELSLAAGNDAEFVLGTRVTGIDRDLRMVHTDDGAAYGYDALVLATGARPFVPPVPGADLPGCFEYRTLADLDALRAYAAGKRTGAVIGGGLLGLEAAQALRSLGLTAQIVEYAPHLMPAQLDPAGGALLRRLVEDLGITVHTEVSVTAIRREWDPSCRDSDVRGPLIMEGPGIEVDVVVFAAGVRPRDELARQAGLAVAARGGIHVDALGRTADPAVYAIGDCAAIDGRAYGLIAPGYALAKAVAAQLNGTTPKPATVDTATKLKLLGVDVASFGVTSGPLDVVYSDPAHAVYAKLVLSDDARTLLGGVLVGDASAYPSLRAALGGPPPGKLAELLTTPADIPGSAQVCSCHAVTKDTVAEAVAAGCSDLAGLKACTKAGTGCGSCVPLLKTFLSSSSKALCEHFTQSRQELFDLVRVRRITTFSALVAAHGTGGGCDVCKPAVASILASLGNGHILDGEQAALQDTNDHFLANLQKDGSYSVVPRIPGGEITPDKLITIGEVARDFGLYTKITGGQRIDLFGARVEQLPLIWRRLVDAGFESGHAYGKALRTVKSCVGSTWCRYGVQDSVGLAVELELRYRGLRSPHKIKSAVSGCARECAEARGKDFGVIATENGWNLYLGGNGGFQPRHADLFLTDLSTADLVRYIDRFLMYYIRTADRLQRTSAWLEALDGGLEHLRAVIVDDELGLCAELDAAMAGHVASYADEWRAVLDDPAKLSRFVSFVNAPREPDPSIAFTVERGQPVPAGGPR
ncbi:nitrite reductase large subunit NirB [Longispora albida]|uniref:nitrite reductase large subunit NirB n=1 Tax=Longispora albida TaxID=203523 RepID=UPI00039D5D1D|nr:nitrite reductase large subunit NirB [Longispora albida]